MRIGQAGERGEAATANRTIAIGDIHGELEHLRALVRMLPKLDAQDTLVFLGDYLDRGPDSAGVVEFVRRELPAQTPARIVALRGNHEDAWLRVVSVGLPGFVMPAGNGCRECQRSFVARTPAGEPPHDDIASLFAGTFFPYDVLEWMRALPLWHEDEHALYVHATLARADDGSWLHPRENADPQVLLWGREEDFFRDYAGKRVVCGHTRTRELPRVSAHTPEDHADLWVGPSVLALDTACGKGGFLTAVELPSFVVYETR